jgi:hypothetical protein
MPLHACEGPWLGSTAEGGPALAGYSSKLYSAWDGPPTGSGSFTIDYAAGP